MRAKARPFNRRPAMKAASFTLHSAAGTSIVVPRSRRILVAMAALVTLCRAAAIVLAATGAVCAAEAETKTGGKPVCLDAADTREQVKAHKLIEPYAALKSAARERKAEALSAKLCASGDDFVYEITLLHRDGRLIRVQMDAGTGKLLARPGQGRDTKDAGRDPRDPPPKN
jgi:uncharacterized membrane protein YkoI